MGTTKEEILDYVMETPGNTNRAVLKDLLDDLHPDPNYLCFTAEEVGSTIAMEWAIGEEDYPNIFIEYSVDGHAWNEFTIGETVITLNNIGDKVYMRGNNESLGFLVGDEEYNYLNGVSFVMTGKIAASGDIMYLLDINHTDVLNKYSFARLFQDCQSLTTAPELPATTLTDMCYSHLFYGCTNLTTAPELPATTLADECYDSMFCGCESLTIAPELPATTLADGCYYNMFCGCDSLTIAPELPATTLADGCYYKMFYGCGNLSAITVHFTEWSTEADETETENWLAGVANEGTFTCPAALADERDDSAIPQGWTKVDL